VLRSKCLLKRLRKRKRLCLQIRLRTEKAKAAPGRSPGQLLRFYTDAILAGLWPGLQEGRRLPADLFAFRIWASAAIGRGNHLKQLA
jgi:hypothetical protein